MRQLRINAISFVIVALTMACGATPKTSSDAAQLERGADQTLAMMMQKDPGLNYLLGRSAGYVVFPEVGKGGFIAGAAHGRGILYEHGHKTGYVELNQGSIGAQIGAQSFAELVALEQPYDVQRLKRGEFSIGGNASAVALTAGAAAGTQFVSGVAVFVVPHGGVMAELSLNGQQLNYAPLGG
jgi:lipid-binding SYLF domain-containing protein